jgi:hypothetical protein
MLETPEYPALLAFAVLRLIHPTSTVGVVESGGSDNATGAVNQQERLDAYIAGFVDGEGSFQLSRSLNGTRC